ncbi:hypothetical protein B0H13DRAFT_1864276 [Mycena leptocephala]|nr:hypothetical protein B0H13DRAFT_1864276 [Mycena leptocephala]
MVNAARNAHARTRIREQPPGTAPPPPARAAAADESWCWSGCAGDGVMRRALRFRKRACWRSGSTGCVRRKIIWRIEHERRSSGMVCSRPLSSVARNIKVQFRAFLGKVCERTSVQSGRDRSPLVPSSEGFPLGGALFCTPSGCRGWGADGAHTVVEGGFGRIKDRES